MNIKNFNSFLQELFNIVNINNQLQLNGSYKSEYFALDIDLYNQIKNQNEFEKIPKIIDKLRDNYILSEIKYSFKNGNQQKTKHIYNYEYNELSFIKIDIIIFFHIFPMECSIIYDMESEKTYNEKTMIIDMIHDLKEKNYNKFKKIKRINTIFKIMNIDASFLDPILEDININVLYISIYRLKFIKELLNNKLINNTDYDRYYQIIHEDLRKIELKPTDNLEEFLNKEISDKL